MTEDNNLRKTGANLLGVAKFGIAAFYVLLGVFVGIFGGAAEYLDDIQAKAIGVLLVVYGLFRGFRAYQNIKDDEL